MQTGSRNPPKPELVTTRLPSRGSSRWRTDTGCNYNLVTENDINVISAAARQCFWTRTIHFHRHRHCTTSVNTTMYKPEALITQKRQQISTRSQGLMQCFGEFQVWLRSNLRRPTSKNSFTGILPVLRTVPLPVCN